MTVSNFISYENYKDTSITWLEKSPAHWEIKRLKDIGTSIIGLTYSPDEMVDNADEGILVLRSSNIQNRALDLSSTVYVKKAISTKLALKKGDILICSRNGSRALIGKNICIDERVAGQTFGAFMTVYRSKYFKFLSKFFNSKIFESQSGLFMSSTVNQLTQNTLNNFLILLPPLEEQQAIADYLDAKTAQIDRKIELLEQKAEKYADLKKSLINETVTRGLDKRVPMKDSGVEWIGQIPAHWEVKRLKDIASIQNSNVDKKSHEHEIPVRLCNYVDVYKNEYIESSLEFMKATADESEISRFGIKKNDVLITKDSETFDDIAVPALVIETMEDVICGYHLAQIRTNKRIVSGAYLFRLFQSQRYGFRFMVNAKGITRVGLGQSAIADALTPIPPLTEQEAIVDFLKSKTAHIEKIIGTIYLEAEKLYELRKTLINDVVTGKIKVYEETIHE